MANGCFSVRGCPLAAASHGHGALQGRENFEFIRHDVTDAIKLEIDQIYHLACPASPVHYKYNPIKTTKTSFIGTLNMLGLAKRTGARFLLTSTSYDPSAAVVLPFSLRWSITQCMLRWCTTHLQGGVRRPSSASADRGVLGKCQSYR